MSRRIVPYEFTPEQKVHIMHDVHKFLAAGRASAAAIGYAAIRVHFPGNTVLPATANQIASALKLLQDDGFVQVFPRTASSPEQMYGQAISIPPPNPYCYADDDDDDDESNARRIGVFWKDNSSDFPTWTKLAQLVMLLQPSSAAAERVFSRLLAILKRPGMDSSLIDYLETCLMLAYNGGGKQGYSWAVGE
jgi:hypothetical protein